MTERQIGLYHEFRDAVDFSLESLATSEMARTAQAAKMRIADRGMRMGEALDFYTDQIDAKLDEAKMAAEDMRLRHEAETDNMQGLHRNPCSPAVGRCHARANEGARHAQEAAELADQVDGLQSMRDGFTGKADQIRALQNEGYAPLMRFGQYIVDVAKFDENSEPVIGDDGNPDRPFFGMFETEAEAKGSGGNSGRGIPGLHRSRGVASQYANEMFNGVTPEAGDVRADAWRDRGRGFQAYLKQAIANRSAMKRLIKRKGEWKASPRTCRVCWPPSSPATPAIVRQLALWRHECRHPANPEAQGRRDRRVGEAGEIHPEPAGRGGHNPRADVLQLPWRIRCFRAGEHDAELHHDATVPRAVRRNDARGEICQRRHESGLEGYGQERDLMRSMTGRCARR